MLNLPNILTLSRVFVIPFIIIFYSNGNYFLAFWLAAWGGVSDFLDGYAARKLNISSPLGALLDPVADKFFEMALCLYFLTVAELPLYYVSLLWLRNIAQLMAIPILGWWLKIPFKVEPKWPAKWGSAFGFIIIAFIITHQVLIDLFPQIFWGWIPMGLIYGLVPISAGFEFYILITYLPRFVQILKGEHDTFY